MEPNSLSASEWQELEALLDDDAEAPLKFSMRTSNEGKGVMTVQRVALNEPWLYFFAAGYDSDRRFAINVMLFTPSAWSGLTPD